MEVEIVTFVVKGSAQLTVRKISPGTTNDGILIATFLVHRNLQNDHLLKLT